MEKFEELLKSYFNLPYRPEYLVKKVRDAYKEYQLEIIHESNNKINQKSFENIFLYIFNERNYTFNNKVEEPKSIDNFKNFLYESCKNEENKINYKEILFYLFIFEEFGDSIINAIYKSILFFDLQYNIYYNIIYQFLYYKNTKTNKKIFDEKYFTKWIEENRKEKNYNSLEENKDNKGEFIKINFLKYNYYGPNEAKYNYILNKKDTTTDKVVLFSPNALIKNGYLKEYNENNFQVFNENNICPNLFIYMLKEAIKVLNKKINNDLINDNIINDDIIDDDIINDVGVIEFNDNTAGIYLNMSNPSQFFEMEDLLNTFNKDKNEDFLEVVFSSSNVTESKVIREENQYSIEQERYMHYNSYVNEEQLANTIINSIGDEILDEGMDRLPRVIFYFNLYIFESENEKKRIAFTNKENGYGFEEADGIFYLESKDLVLNKSNIPFLKKMSFDLFTDTDINNNNNKKFKSNEEQYITIKKNSLIYMEAKTSFPLKIEKDSNEKKINGVQETKHLIYNIIRKSKKFYEIANNKKNTIQKIHILFLYDSFLQSNDDIQLFKNEFNLIFENLKIKIQINTTFDVIYFVNPSSINIRNLTNTFIKLKKDNQAKMEELQKENMDSKKKMEELQKDNQAKLEKLKKDNQAKLEELQKDNMDSKKKMEELQKDNMDSKKKMEELQKDNQAKLEKLQIENKTTIDDLLAKINDLQKQIEILTDEKKNKEKINNNIKIDQNKNNVKINNNNENKNNENINNNIKVDQNKNNDKINSNKENKNKEKINNNIENKNKEKINNNIEIDQDKNNEKINEKKNNENINSNNEIDQDKNNDKINNNFDEKEQNQNNKKINNNKIEQNQNNKKINNNKIEQNQNNVKLNNTNNIIELYANNNKLNNNSNIVQNPNSIDLTMSNNKLNILSEINKKKITIFNIIGLKDGFICLISNENSYIIKNNSLIKTLNGYRKVVLSLENKNILTSKNEKVIIYDNITFNTIKEIRMKEFAKQIIEINKNKKDNKNNNELLFLSENSKIKLIEDNNYKDINYNIKKDICTIIETNIDQIVILYQDASLSFFNFKKKEETAQIKIQNNNALKIDYNDIFFIDGDFLYISLFSSIIKIDIEKKIMIHNYELKMPKIYRFNNNFFGIYKNKIYILSDLNEEIKTKIICSENENIYSLFQSNNNQIIYCTNNEVKLSKFK